ncbi:capsule biosynthesis protein CapA [Roseobacter sp. HKCCA0434]|uniref:capsular polysaccharide export protein, LipB/KpsS family n=1 Tax=Roseobacter sp. HKCCA0434 TaxID=3079297 RepID=UPI0029058E59|nr:capsule biosynthesis protein CapA [Roseobacter sp. HKCCA0434]
MARHFLLMQGPHGPFWAELAARLRAAGQEVSRVALNAGDAHGWGDGLWRCDVGAADLRGWLQPRLASRGVTDLVLYGDHREVHRIAGRLAHDAGLRLHYLEEGYLRPHWITYERDGVNGRSPLMNMSMERIRAVARDLQERDRAAPDQWGAMGGHLWHGLLYHARVASGARHWPAYRTHRPIDPARERALALRGLIDLPLRRLRRSRADARLRRAGVPYHVALLQLGHDASVQAHSPYRDMRGFVTDVAVAFARSAPMHHHLVFKLHPFEDGRESLPRHIRAITQELGLAARTHILEGERLATLLDAASSAVTINSTAAQQALWRGLPVWAAGQAIYSKPGLVSNQSLGDFFAAPFAPDRVDYLAFRRLLLASSQVKGGFYTASGRAQALRRLIDMILADEDPYGAIGCHTGATGAEILPLNAPGA